MEMSELSDSSPTALSVIVVGGGLCGLSSAIAISLGGHKVTVFEASDRIHPFGSGLQSSPNGTRLLSKWGLNEILQPAVTAPKSLQIHSVDGVLLSRHDSLDDGIFVQHGSPLWTLHRLDLQAGLLRRANELGVQIHFSSPVTDLDSLSPIIQLADGTKHHGDLVVVADGTWSALRSKVLGATINPEPTNDMAYRINVDRAKVQNKEVLELMDSPQIRVWIGPGSYAIGYPVRGNRQFCVLLILSDRFHQPDSNPGTTIDEIRMRLKKWDPMLTAMLDAAERVNKWRLCRVLPLPVWVSSRTTSVLAGDCCHSIHPFLAQGLNMGLEDAAILGHLLEKVTSTGQLPKAIGLYNSLRTNRLAKVLEETDVYTNALMDDTMEGIPKEHMDWTFMKAQEWIWSYDAYKEAEAAYVKEPY